MDFTSTITITNTDMALFGGSFRISYVEILLTHPPPHTILHIHINQIFGLEKKMNLYMWDSEIMAAYSKGKIIVMAESVELARQKTVNDWTPLQDDSETEDFYLISLKDLEDDGLEEEMERKYQILLEDISKEPRVLCGMVLLGLEEAIDEQNISRTISR